MFRLEVPNSVLCVYLIFKIMRLGEILRRVRDREEVWRWSRGFQCLEVGRHRLGRSGAGAGALREWSSRAQTRMAGLTLSEDWAARVSAFRERLWWLPSESRGAGGDCSWDGALWRQSELFSPASYFLS